jgi:hypothetical protein
MTSDSGAYTTALTWTGPALALRAAGDDDALHLLAFISSRLSRWSRSGSSRLVSGVGRILADVIRVSPVVRPSDVSMGGRAGTSIPEER